MLCEPVKSVIVEPTGTAPLAVIVFLHGLGANGHDFEPIARQLLPVLPMRWVLPHAPSMPVTINGGMPMPAWYDLTDLSRADGVDWQSVERTKIYIRSLLEEEQARNPGLPIFLGGFSQGAAISLHCGYDAPVPIKGIVALSGYLLAKSGQSGLPAQLAPETAPALFMGHGDWDDVVPPALASNSRDVIREAGLDIEWHNYPMPHSVSPRELQDLVFWLMRQLGIQLV